MIVEQIWTANNYRNFNYLIACPETGDAVAVDPLDTEKCLRTVREKGWTVRYILNTHEHHPARRRTRCGAPEERRRDRRPGGRR